MNEKIDNLIVEYSSEFDYSKKNTAIILAAGHGKRIKSNTSKMLHKIWGVPTVERVYDACKKGLDSTNLIIVVGIKAEDVIKVIGKREATLFAHQAEQNGTGHAVQVALEKFDMTKYDGTVYVFPGDMGLIDAESVSDFKDSFDKSKMDMMVLTGLYEGDPIENSYGRIIRVKDKDINGNSANEDEGKVVEIKENKDIHSLDEKKQYQITFNDRVYGYSKNELIENNEFNSGVYSFKSKPLLDLIHKIESNNAQKEIYITDLIGLFNKAKYSVGAVSPQKQYVIMGFNNKSVLKQMEAIYRKLQYEKLKDIVEIDDPEDFYIAEDVIENIIEADKAGTPLDLKIGKGVYIGKGVNLNYNIELKKNVFIDGNVSFGTNIKIWENAHLSCYPNQSFIINDNVEILWGDIIKGNIIIGEGARIESSVNMTGSDEYPLRIGKNVIIKGTSYIFGSIIDDDIFIEHSVIIQKKVDKLIKKDGKIQKIKFYLPMPEGIDAIEELK
ncbi:MAG: NTP transferase domain-containing protein [Melioribacteraceae bacterium]|nr:NTP transferase domain-containing protein [Melioribacteraceae bacterium]